MDLVTVFLCSVITLALLALKWFYSDPPGFPPGPKGLFLLGYLPYIKPRSYIKVAQLKAEYGDVVSLRIGIRRVVYLLSYKAIEEALVKKGDNFVGRIKSKFFSEITRDSGIVLTDGKVWQEQRRFTLHALRDFGFGRNLSQQYIQEEGQRLVERLAKSSGQPLDPFDPVMRAVSSIVCRIAFSECPAYDDDEFNNVFDGIRKMVNIPFHKMLPFSFPFLAYFNALVKLSPPAKMFKKNMENAHDYIRKKIEQHRATIDLKGEPRDFMDAFLQEQAKQQASGEPHTFTEWQLLRVITELFAAGTDTTATSLHWFLLMVSLNPDIQTRIHQEIDSVIGRTRQPEMNDKKHMPYLTATLDEVMRYASVAPNAVLHRNLHEDTVGGYRIPANSTVVPCTYACHHDPAVWPEPSKFRPERFLSADGKEYKQRDELIPFSTGRRSCLGEPLAKMEFFLFSAILMQRFSVKLYKDENFDLDRLLMGLDGFIRTLEGYQAILDIRE